jgi:hypothetical protein
LDGGLFAIGKSSKEFHSKSSALAIVGSADIFAAGGIR